MTASDARGINPCMDRDADNRELATKRVSVDRQVTAVRLGLLEDVLATVRYCTVRGDLIMDVQWFDEDGRLRKGRIVRLDETDVSVFAEGLLELVQQ